MSNPFTVDRTLTIHARRATVFRFFTDSARWARWWGAGSTIDPVIGGAVLIVYPNGARASGVVRELVPDERLAFTYGYEGKGAITPGGSVVTITLADAAGDTTRLVLCHAVADAATRDQHVQGWRHQLAVFASVVSDEALAGADAAIAAWFTAWNDAAGARALLAPAVTGDVHFQDAHADVRGLDELVDHVAAVARFMPGLRLEPRGKLRRSHGVALADWAIVKPDGAVAMTGTNVVRLAPDGRIAEVTGIPA